MNLARGQLVAVICRHRIAVAEMAEVSSTGYGKNSVRLLRLRRDGARHSVCELRVSVQLELATTQDYHRGDNRDVIATDSQKNTILVFARRHAVREVPW